MDPCRWVASFDNQRLLRRTLDLAHQGLARLQGGNSHFSKEQAAGGSSLILSLFIPRRSFRILLSLFNFLFSRHTALERQHTGLAKDFTYWIGEEKIPCLLKFMFLLWFRIPLVMNNMTEIRMV